MKEQAICYKIDTAINRCRNIVVMGHVDPDADCIGAMLAIKLALENETRKIDAVLANQPPDNLFFLPGIEQIIPLEQYQQKPDMILLVDCSDLERAGAEAMIESWRDIPIAVIDHHDSATPMGDLLWIKPAASATCELIYELLKNLQIPLNKEIATCIYAGIVSDTGCFRYQNTTPECFIYASDLLTYHIDTQLVRVQLFECRTLASIKMIGTAMVSLEEVEPWLVMMKLTIADKQKYGARAQDCNNIINYALYKKGAEVALLFDEIEENKVKVSFRSRDNYNVGKIAMALGGGGHVAAAGATMMCSLLECIAQVVETVKKEIKVND